MGKPKLLASSAAVGLLLFAAACDDFSAVVTNYHRGAIVWSSAIDRGAKGPLLAQVGGDPFGMGAVAFGHLVRGRMAAAVQSRRFTYTGDEAAAAHPAFRIIVLFGAPSSANAGRICAGGLPALAPDLGVLHVRAVICDRDELLADAEGTSKQVENPGQERFKTLIGDLTRALLKPD